MALLAAPLAMLSVAIGAAGSSSTKAALAGPSLEGGLEEFLELRPFCSSNWVTRVARVVTWTERRWFWSTISSSRSRTLLGVACQSAWGIPAGGRVITGGL